MNIWTTILIIISIFLIIIASSELKNVSERTLSLALIGLVVALIFEAFYLASGRR